MHGRSAYFLVAGTLIALVLLLSARWSDPAALRWVDRTVQTVAYPFQASAHALTRSIRDLFRYYLWLTGLKQENKRLHTRISVLEESLNRYFNDAVRFTILRQQLAFRETDPQSKVFAEVIGESTDSLHQTLLINKGSHTGIQRNDPVQLREGLVGRIQSVSGYQAIVQLITDRRHRFPVSIQSLHVEHEGADKSTPQEAPGENVSPAARASIERALATGTGGGLRLERIPRRAEIHTGGRVLTNGLAGLFPQGILIGYVRSVQRLEHDLFQTAEVEPAVDFQRVEGVFVITKSPQEADFADPER